jgi:hypothetical protein
MKALLVDPVVVAKIAFSDVPQPRLAVRLGFRRSHCSGRVAGSTEGARLFGAVNGGA